MLYVNEEALEMLLCKGNIAQLMEEGQKRRLQKVGGGKLRKEIEILSHIALKAKFLSLITILQ